MANELTAQYTTGVNLYLIIYNNAGQAYNGSAFETWVNGNLSTYARNMTEAGSSRNYYADMPALAEAEYLYTVYHRQGGSPALGDLDYRVGGGTVDWTGSAVRSPGRLTAAGLDAIAVTDPGGMASITTWPKMVVALFRWFYKKTAMTTDGAGSGTIITYADDGTTPNVTITVSETTTSQTKGAGA